MPYSFSKISIWNTCPRKFKYKYIDDVEPDEIDATPLKRGLNLHSILENYNGEIESVNNDIIVNFINSKIGQKYLSGEVLSKSIRELQIGLKYENDVFIPVENCVYSKDLIFYGKIDYICVVDGVLNLIDWKSGKYKDMKYQSFDQLLYYAIYFFLKEKKINTIRISYVYIEHQLENNIYLEREFLDKYIKNLKSEIYSVETSEFEKKPNQFCYNCQFNEHCTKDINK